MNIIKNIGKMLEAEYSLEMTKIPIALLRFAKASACKNSYDT